MHCILTNASTARLHLFREHEERYLTPVQKLEESEIVESPRTLRRTQNAYLSSSILPFIYPSLIDFVFMDCYTSAANGPCPQYTSVYNCNKWKEWSKRNLHFEEHRN
jgi:hypothetical protein